MDGLCVPWNCSLFSREGAENSYNQCVKREKRLMIKCSGCVLNSNSVVVFVKRLLFTDDGDARKRCKGTINLPEKPALDEAGSCVVMK